MGYDGKSLAVSILMGSSFLAAGALQSMAADPTITVFGHRYPLNEYYMEKIMPSALAGVKVEPRLSNYPQFREKIRIGLSAGSDELDLIHCSAASIRSFVKNGWLTPIDDLWEKYSKQYNLDDIPKSVVDNMRYEGKLYAVPMALNTMMFFYRKDLFDEKGVSPPKTMAEYVKLAKMFHTPRRSGTQLSMKMVETGINQVHWHFNAHGPGWLDKDFKPIFNQPHGVEAIETLKELAKYSAPGYLSNGNNESTVLFQQGLSVMGLQWASRAKAMDDPKKSKVVGKMEWAAPPGGGSRMVVIGWCLPSASDVDRETRFKLLMEATKRENMMGSAGFAIPARTSVLNDPAVRKANRYYPAVMATLETARDVPPLPEYSEVGEFMMRRIHQALSGELEVKEALDLAAKEAEAHLRKRGYFK